MEREVSFFNRIFFIKLLKFLNFKSLFIRKFLLKFNTKLFIFIFKYLLLKKINIRSLSTKKTIYNNNISIKSNRFTFVTEFVSCIKSNSFISSIKNDIYLSFFSFLSVQKLMLLNLNMYANNLDKFYLNKTNIFILYFNLLLKYRLNVQKYKRRLRLALFSFQFQKNLLF